MATETDTRLRSWLDSNQRDREHMCRSIVALDARYTEVHPRHPLGGPDGGRDIECQFNGEIGYGAVGFQNSANDSSEQKKAIKRKFSTDLKAAKKAKSDLKTFVFLTNVHLTQSEQNELKKQAKGLGIEHCDVLDRERLRIELDAPSGFFVRFQYLGIPLSEAEQASFLARYGDQINQVVTTGFQRIERTLNRILFLQEAQDELGYLHFRFNLIRSFKASEIGHFRAFVTLFLHDVQNGIYSLWFGSTDKSNRFREDLDDDRKNQPSGISYGVASGAWEGRMNLSKKALDDDFINNSKYEDSESRSSEDDYESTFRTNVQVNSGSGVGVDPVSALVASYRNEQSDFRIRKGLSLKDLEDSMYLPVVNKSLADKIESIEVFAGGYLVASIRSEDFKIDTSVYDFDKPHKFSPDELSDPWVRLRPASANSAFHLEFSSLTPTRMYEHQEVSVLPLKKTE